MKQTGIWILLIVSLIFSATGCVNLKQPPAQMAFYTLEYAPPAKSNLPKAPAVIRMGHFSVAPFYDSDRIVYREKAFTLNDYVYHKWQTHPGTMVSYFLARDMEASSLFNTVYFYPRGIMSTHVISGTVDEFYEQDNDDSWKAVLSVTITLMKEDETDAAKKIIFQKQYTATETCTHKNPRSLAQAMSLGLSGISEKIRSDVYASITAETNISCETVPDSE